MIPESVLSPSESASVSGHVPVGPDLGATHHVASGGIDHHGIHMTDDRPSPYTTRDDFAAACDDLSIRHTRTKPRHAWTNGFVERLQGTILHEHWRVVFRRYFTARGQLETSLQSFLACYYDQRPHPGIPYKGRTPPTLFWGLDGISREA